MPAGVTRAPLTTQTAPASCRRFTRQPLLCQWHHTAVHEGGVSMTRDADRWVFHKPDGQPCDWWVDDQNLASHLDFALRRRQTHDRLAAVDSFNIQTRKRSVPAGTVNPSLSNFLNRQQSKINKPHDKGLTNTLIGWRTPQPLDRSIRSWWLGDGCVRRRFSIPIGDSPQSANRCTRLACAGTHSRGRRTRSWHRTASPTVIAPPTRSVPSAHKPRSHPSRAH
jgi:hypothetical protein